MKKVIKKTQAAKPQPLKKEAPAAKAGPAWELLFAKDAVPGEKYTTYSCELVSVLRGTKTVGSERQVVLGGYSRQGHSVADYPVSPWFPLMRAPDVVEKITADYERRRAYKTNGGEEEGVHEAAKPQTRTVTNEDGEEVEVPVAASKRKPSAPRAGRDPKTDCTPGTSAHAVGLIMLGEKPGKDHRVRCVARMVKELQMGKPLAQSWYSTHARKRAEIYGRLQTA